MFDRTCAPPAPRTDKPATSACPRCGAAFRCGVMAREACACYRIPVSPRTLAVLQAMYSECVCGDCLRAVEEGAPVRA